MRKVYLNNRLVEASVPMDENAAVDISENAFNVSKNNLPDHKDLRDKDDVKSYAKLKNLTYVEYDTSPNSTCVEVDLAHGLKGFWYYDDNGNFENYEELDAFS